MEKEVLATINWRKFRTKELIAVTILPQPEMSEEDFDVKYGSISNCFLADALKEKDIPFIGVGGCGVVLMTNGSTYRPSKQTPFGHREIKINFQQNKKTHIILEKCA